MDTVTAKDLKKIEDIKDKSNGCVGKEIEFATKLSVVKIFGDRYRELV